MTHLTDSELDALEAMEKAATPGEWHAARHGRDFCGRKRTSNITIANDGDEFNTYPDSQFIAAARNAMPALLAMARRLREHERAWGLHKDNDAAKGMG